MPKTTRLDRWLAIALGAATFAMLWATQRPIGFMRDEGFYFTAASSYQQWFVESWHAIQHGEWSRPFSDAFIVRYWSNNSEHPAFVKIWFALSNLLFEKQLHWLDYPTSFRFPAFLFSAVLTWTLFWLARPAGRSVAVLAPLLFWAVPRHFFHGHLACFDMPVVTTWCLFFLAYARAIERRRGAVWAGVAFGIALATKHNAFFLPFVVVAHWMVTERRDIWIALRTGPRYLLRRVPAPMWAMAVLGPVILYLHWPYLWHHPIDRVGAWIGFHRQHVNYPWQYMGVDLRAPPFPIEYPVMLEILTVPVATLLAIAIGSGITLSRAAATFSTRARRWAHEATSREWLLLLGAAVAIAPFMTRDVPIFGGVKHWMASMGPASIAAAVAIVRIAQELTKARRQVVAAALGVAVLVPGCLATAHFHPFGTSAYTEIAGAGSGGAELGMQRQYWSNNVTGVLDWINQHAPPHAPVYFHEVTMQSFQAYQANGDLRRDIRYVGGIGDASIVVYQYMQEFRDTEFQTWNAFGTRTPADTFAIDEAPQIVVYSRDDLSAPQRFRR